MEPLRYYLHCLLQERKREILPPYWVSTSPRAHEYCFDCCRKAVEAANVSFRENGQKVAEVDGGWKVIHDHAASCHTCSQPLQFSLSSSGAKNALQYFNDPGTLIETITPGLANLMYQTISIIETITQTKQDTATGTPIQNRATYYASDPETSAQLKAELMALEARYLPFFVETVPESSHSQTTRMKI